MVNKPTSVDEYISAFSPEVQQKLQQVRSAIQKAAPEAEEKISWSLAAYKLHGRDLIYFGGFKNHIGLYAAPTATLEFKDDITKYKTGKGSIQFPLSEPLPLYLIKRIVRFRADENLKKAR